MYKIQTKISFFRYGTTITTEPLLVTWFRFDEQNKGTCFSKEDLFRFAGLIKSRPDNFQDPLYLDCNKLSANFNFNSHLLDSTIHIPKILILTKTPREYKNGEIFECMDIVLTNANKIDYHNYYLKFDLLGQVEC